LLAQLTFGREPHAGFQDPLLDFAADQVDRLNPQRLGIVRQDNARDLANITHT
jgi:hypothetical protein